MKIGIIIATYWRPDGSTKEYLCRALDSIVTQTHTDYEVWVMGDDYQDLSEFFSIAELYKQFHFVSNPIAVERESYGLGDYRLYCSGGLTTFQNGIDRALKLGKVQYICQLDHDDWWEPNHLELINTVLEKYNPMFVCTISSYDPSKKLGNHLPYVEISGHVEEYMPRNQGCCASSSCVKYGSTDLRARDVFKETGQVFPADADFWIRLASEMRLKGEIGYLIRTLTCHHDEEGSSYLKFKQL